MPILNPDTSEAQDFTVPIEEGVYKARITSAEPGKSKQGNDKIVLKMDVDVNGQKRTRQTHIVVKGEGSFTFDRLLRATGMAELADAYKDKTINPKPPFDTDTLVGQEVQVVITHQVYRNPATNVDEIRDQVKDYLPD